jgi:hypothetical protein
MNVMAFSSRYVLCLFRISRSSQSRSTRILLLQDLANAKRSMISNPIQSKLVECPPFLVLSCKKLEHVFADEQGDAFDRLPIQRRWSHLCVQRTCTHPGPREWVPFPVSCPPLASVHLQKSVFGWQSPWYGPIIDYWPLTIQFLC